MFWFGVLTLYVVDEILRVYNDILNNKKIRQHFLATVGLILIFVMLCFFIGFMQAVIIFGTNLFLWVGEILSRIIKYDKLTLTNVVLRITMLFDN